MRQGAVAGRGCDLHLPPNRLIQMQPDSQRPPDEGEEIVHYDDAVIGRAFRWSAIALIGILVIGAGTFLFLKQKPAPPPPKITQIEAPVAQSFAEIKVPEARFTDITAAA